MRLVVYDHIQEMVVYDHIQENHAVNYCPRSESERRNSHIRADRTRPGDYGWEHRARGSERRGEESSEVKGFLLRQHSLTAGTVVVVALDPVSSLAMLNDTAAETAASRVVTQKRLAIVINPLLGSPDYMRHDFCPIGRGLPRDVWAAVAIRPQSSQLGGRAPVSMPGSLPVKDACVHTAHAFEGSVSRLYTDAPSGIRISAEDATAVCLARISDRNRLKFGEGWDADDRKVRYEDEGEDDAWEPRPLCDPIPFPTPTFICPHYQVWLTVGDTDEFADPSTLEAELEQLRAIETEWRHRRTAEVEAKEQRLAQWRKTLTDQAWEADDEQGYAFMDPVGDCLAPEDAPCEASSGFGHKALLTHHVGNEREHQHPITSDHLVENGPGCSGMPQTRIQDVEQDEQESFVLLLGYGSRQKARTRKGDVSSHVRLRKSQNFERGARRVGVGKTPSSSPSSRRCITPDLLAQLHA
ncbi:hypothetical protein AURDEDRAFT_125996 [Auricularia subglabra TFB-10046 SS5]|nr:hypothetical protein AURDEDRAFT_125996 [Auricularia subglabra TFB-10046 SS5]